MKSKLVHILYGDKSSGAGKAVVALHNLLKKSDRVQSNLLLTHGNADCLNNERLIPVGYRVYLKFMLGLTRMLRTRDIDLVMRLPKFLKLRLHEYDIVHLHSVNGIMLGVFDLRSIMTVVTFRDYWFITGACHYPMSCNKYSSGCANCPLPSRGVSFVVGHLIKRSYYLKRRLLQQSRLHSITRKNLTELYYAKYIMNLTDDLFYNVALSKPRDKRFVSGAQRLSDKNKTSIYNEMAFLISNELHLFGNLGSYKIQSTRIVHHGFLSAIELRDLLLSSQVFIMTSRQEMFGKTVLEALLCGCFVIGFKDTGYSYLIEQGVNGYLVDSVQEMLEFVVDIDKQSSSAFEVDHNNIAISTMNKIDLSTIMRDYENLYLEDFIKDS